MEQGRVATDGRRYADDARHRRPRQPGIRTGVGRSAGDDDSSFTQAVDGRLGRVRAHGRWTPQAAEMLRSTVEALHGGGHVQVRLDLSAVRAVDDAGLDAIRSLQDRISAAGGHLTVVDVPGPASPVESRLAPRG